MLYDDIKIGSRVVIRDEKFLLDAYKRRLMNVNAHMIKMHDMVMTINAIHPLANEYVSFEEDNGWWFHCRLLSPYEHPELSESVDANEMINNII